MESKSRIEEVEAELKAMCVPSRNEPGTAFILMTPRERVGDKQSLLHRCWNLLTRLLRLRRDEGDR